MQHALREAPGDLLVFLPGAGEIRRTHARLLEADLGTDVDVLPLYGELAPGEQDAALAPARAGRRKVVLATNIAETSLTIDGVRVVVDSGLERRSVFDPASGMSRLETQRISRASAEQRAGRAGRTAPGVCYRLWGESAERTLAAYAPAEILNADLAPLALDLAVWGTDAASLRWLDAPPAATLASARDLLRRLGALDARGRVTPHGRAMHELGAHPRLAHMLLAAREHGAPRRPRRSSRRCFRSATCCAARRAPAHATATCARRIDALRRGHGGEHAIDRGALERVRRAERAFLKAARCERRAARRTRRSRRAAARVRVSRPHREAPARAATRAISSRTAAARRSRSPSRSRARNSSWPSTSTTAAATRASSSRRRSIAPTCSSTSRAQLVRADEVAWDARTEAVVARRIVRLGELVLEEKPLQRAAAGRRGGGDGRGLALARARGAAVGRREPRLRGAQRVRARARPRRRRRLARSVGRRARCAISRWLEPFLEGVTRRAHLERVPLAAALRARLTREQQRKLDELAPTHVALPTGTRAQIDYLDDNAPCASMRMQEVFGLAATPRIARRRGAAHVQAAVARAPAAAGDARSRELLAQRVRRRAQGHARPLSAPLLARESARSGADEAREAAAESLTRDRVTPLGS